MSKLESGRNLPQFRAVQLDFTAHIRNPDIYPRPVDVEPRRMQIYLDLVFNNIQDFLANTFPVAKGILGQDKWLELVRSFVHRHGSASPYFLQISEEFLTFLHEQADANLPDFLLELCHYEWVELALDVASEPAYPLFDEDGDLSGRQVVSQVMRALTYRYPVHEIGEGFRPETAPEDETFLIVYRRRDLEVRFMASNIVTHRLLELIAQRVPSDAITRLTEELNAAGRAIERPTVEAQALATLGDLRKKGVLLGTVIGDE